MSASAADLKSAIDDAVEQFVAWRAEHRLTDSQLAQITQEYDRWRENLDPAQDYGSLLEVAGLPDDAADEVVHRARSLSFLQREIRRHAAAQRLTAGPADVCYREIKARLGALRVAKSHAGDSAPADEPAAAEPQPAPARSLVDRLLDPRSLQALMACGGGLLVLGLVVWLWSVGVFENRLVVAGLLGGANLAALAGGVALVLRSRYQTAGRGVTLLASLVLPLNLWFYNAQGLITLKDGGHLWIPALVICGLYAATARLIKDARLVYALVGGVTMTGLLLLGDQQVDRFWEVISPSCLLVVIGVASIHIERLFAPGDGPFSREKFGAAFFHAGHCALAAGLGVLLCGRLVGWFYEPLVAHFHTLAMPDVATVANVQLIALGIALTGAYSYFYSIFVSGRGARYAYSGLLSLLWCGVIGLDLLAVPMTEALLTGILAAAAVVAYAASQATLRLATARPGDAPSPTSSEALTTLAASTGSVGSLLVVVTLALGLSQFVRGVFVPDFLPRFELAWPYTAAMLLVTAASFIGAAVQETLQRRGPARTLTQAGGVAAVLASFGLVLPLLAGYPFVVPLAAAGLAPLAMIFVAHLTGAEDRQVAWRLSAQLGGVLLMGAVGAALLGVGPATVATTYDATPLLTGGLFAELALIFGLASFPSRGRAPQGKAGATLAAICCWAAAWQALLLAGLVTYAPVLAASMLGVVFLVVARLRDRHAAGLNTAGAVMTLGGAAAGLLLTTNRLLGGGVEWQLVSLLVGQAAVAVVAALLAKTAGVRRALYVAIAGNLVACVLVINALSILSFGQRMELLLTVLGGVLLFAGHRGWMKESGRKDGLVTFNLAAGSLLATAPLACGLLAMRLGDNGDITGAAASFAWTLLHEVGVLAIGLLLLGAGVLCRIRWTTLAGAAALLTHVVSLVLLIHLPDQLQNIAVYMMIGGATFFATAALLSIYRDRLLQVPDRIRSGEGVFRVLSWR